MRPVFGFTRSDSSGTGGVSSEHTMLQPEPELSPNDFDDVDKSDDNLCFLIYFSGNGDGAEGGS